MNRKSAWIHTLFIFSLFLGSQNSYAEALACKSPKAQCNVYRDVYAKEVTGVCDDHLACIPSALKECKEQCLQEYSLTGKSRGGQSCGTGHCVCDESGTKQIHANCKSGAWNPEPSLSKSEGGVVSFTPNEGDMGVVLNGKTGDLLITLNNQTTQNFQGCSLSVSDNSNFAVTDNACETLGAKRKCTFHLTGFPNEKMKASTRINFVCGAEGEGLKNKIKDLFAKVNQGLLSLVPEANACVSLTSCKFMKSHHHPLCCCDGDQFKIMGYATLSACLCHSSAPPLSCMTLSGPHVDIQSGIYTASGFFFSKNKN